MLCGQETGFSKTDLQQFMKAWNDHVNAINGLVG